MEARLARTPHLLDMENPHAGREGIAAVNNNVSVGSNPLTAIARNDSVEQSLSVTKGSDAVSQIPNPVPASIAGGPSVSRRMGLVLHIHDELVWQVPLQHLHPFVGRSGLQQQSCNPIVPSVIW